MSEGHGIAATGKGEVFAEGGILMRKWWTAAVLAAALACAAAGSAYAGGWVSENGGWRYRSGDDSSQWLSNGWYWLDGDSNGVSECYYFNAEGYMLADTVTPDHYRVNADGAWIDDAGNVQIRTEGPLGHDQTSQTGPTAGGVQQTQSGPSSGAGPLGTDTPSAGTGPLGNGTPNAGQPDSSSAGPGTVTGGESQTPAGSSGPLGPLGPLGTGADTSETQSEAEVVEEQPAATGRVIDPSRPMVALTYDDGPQTGSGNRIMDTLAQYGAKATFFLVGDRCASRASEVQRMVAEGHEVGNHTYQHKYLDRLSADQIRYQISQGSAAIAAAGGAAPALVRLPGGNKNSTVLANVNYPMIQWSIDTRDWDHRNAQKTINEVLSKVRDGDIVLMHELYDATATATETIVPELVARGYQLVTVSEMAQAKGVQLQPGQLYYNFR